MKVLYITIGPRTGAWLAEAFASDSAAEILLEEAVGAAEGLARLGDEVFDAVLVRHEPGVLDALELIEGLRAGGSEEPILALGRASEAEMDAICYEVGADGYCSLETTTTRSLLWTFARAIERHQMIRENRRLVQANRQRLAQERQEAERLLSQQRSLIAGLEQFASTPAIARSPGSQQPDSAPAAGEPAEVASALPEQLVSLYREMLRAYVIMGSGNLTDEMGRLAEMLSEAGVTARQAMHLHVQVLEELIRGLGSRSARHVMNRADLLVLEVMMHLAEGYRRRYRQRTHPAQQLTLPGFDGAPPAASA